VNIHIFK